ncbi:hypothetical protein A9798_07660 [Edwardsiella hoshinae]|uniref:Autotransporter domain-containing protein n=1 Tax=Edwardsiella hoshinae TaxID=93378 RepID=A0ABN4SZ60_9GAMM|nr:autotransporter outer membrane beta-barrel domain-containing protein [Edwardsiella hoshinae]AOV96846.1 hypothetical protein A9798_07660 [Edwardsiella hoshinae]
MMNTPARIGIGVLPLPVAVKRHCARSTLAVAVTLALGSWPLGRVNAMLYLISAPDISCSSAQACVTNDNAVNYTTADSSRIMGIQKDIVSGNYVSYRHILTGLGLENAASGESFYLWNKADGEISLTTDGGASSPRIRAYGMYVDTGMGASNNVVMQNDGVIQVYDSAARQVALGEHDAGMSLITSDGGGHQIWMNNTGQIDVRIDNTRAKEIAAIGMQIQATSVGNAAGNDSSTLYNAGTLVVDHAGGGVAWGIRQFSLGEPLDGRVINTGTMVVRASAAGGSALTFPWGSNAAIGIRSDTATSALSHLRSYNYGSIFVAATADGGIAHGMHSSVDPTQGSVVQFELQNHGLLDVRSLGNQGYAAGMTVGTVYGGDLPVEAQVQNGASGHMTVNAGSNGTAYGIYALLDTTRNGVASTLNVSNLGIIDVSGSVAHQLYLARQGVGSLGTAYVTAWNLALNAAASQEQRVFAVTTGTTLNLGEAAGKGAHFILRAADNGDTEHSELAVSELIAVQGGHVSGSVGRVTSGGNYTGQYAANYQATLEGYASYANQHLYLDRAWQYNPLGESKEAVRCATIRCALYSSTQGVSLLNQGTLDLVGEDSALAALYANLRVQDGVDNQAVTLRNTGQIALHNRADSGAAYGLYVRLQDAAQQAVIHNSGVIDVSGATAHALYVSGEQGRGGRVSDASGGTAHLATWDITLQDRVSGRHSLFAVADGATLNFGDGEGQGSLLILRPGDSALGYADNKRFRVSDMVYNYGNGAQVTGRIGRVTTPLPMLVANTGYLDPAGSTLWDNQWVSLDVEAERGDGPTLSAGSVDSMQNQVERIGQLIVDGSSPLGQGHDEVQMKIYYGHLQRRGVGAADTDSVGTVAYTDYALSPRATLGWHGGIESAWLKAKSHTLKTQSVSAIFGSQGRYQLSDSAYLRGQVSAIVSRDHHRFSAFDGSRAAASLTTSGMYGAFYMGYDYPLDRANIITPEVGVSTLWSHMPALSVHYDRSPELDHRYQSQHYQAWYASASVRWRGQAELKGITYHPTLLAGMKQALGDVDINTVMTFNEQRFAAKVTRDPLRAVIDSGISSAVNAHFALGINYRGEYGAHTTDHIGYLNGTLRF